jgi:hypothetical protein
METFKMIPGIVYSVYDPELYGKANITSPAACLPPPSAYTYTGLSEILPVSDASCSPPPSLPSNIPLAVYTRSGSSARVYRAVGVPRTLGETGEDLG